MITQSRLFTAAWLLMAAAFPLPAAAQLVYDRNAPQIEQDAQPITEQRAVSQQPSAEQAAPAPNMATPEQPDEDAITGATAPELSASEAAAKECLDRAKADYAAGAVDRDAAQTQLENQLRKVCSTGQYNAVKIAINEFLYSEVLRPRFDAIQACLAMNGETLPAKMDPRGKEIISDGKRYCQMLYKTKP